MLLRICFKLSLSRDCLLDLLRGNFVLFRDPMGDHRGKPSVKKIKYSIVHMLESNSKFINPVSKQIGFRPPELMPKLRKSLNSHRAFVECSVRKRIKPFENGHAAVIFFVKDHSDLRHSGTFSLGLLFAILRS